MVPFLTTSLDRSLLPSTVFLGADGVLTKVSKKKNLWEALDVKNVYRLPGLVAAHPLKSLTAVRGVNGVSKQ